MEFVRYRLRSQPGIIVDVPQEYAAKAEALLDLVQSGDPQRVLDAIDDHPYLANLGIIFSATQFLQSEKGTRESLRFWDQVFLRVCIYGMEQIARSSPGKNGNEHKVAFETSKLLEVLSFD
ncbi:hypothetical protein HZB02_06055 [Candidatus Woesearchaeota archaeon]|nr:hypothetical protein [Candidatus Woesearchaeota archaeon]